MVFECVPVDMFGELVATQQPAACIGSDEPGAAARDVLLGVERFQRPYVPIAVDEPGAGAFAGHGDFQCRHRVVDVVPHRQLQLVPAGDFIPPCNFIPAARVVFVVFPQQDQLAVGCIGQGNLARGAARGRLVGAQVDDLGPFEDGVSAFLQVPAELLDEGRRSGQPVAG